MAMLPLIPPLIMQRHNEITLIHAPIELISAALAPLAVEYKVDVIGKQITVSQVFAFVFQLVGHDWTGILLNYGVGNEPIFPELIRLSAQQSIPIILYKISNTSEEIGYQLIRDGDIVESFFAEEEKIIEFNSDTKNITIEEIGDVYDFVYTFFIEQNAFDPGLKAGYFLPRKDGLESKECSSYKSGKQVHVRNNGVNLYIRPHHKVVSIPEFKRVDYLALSWDETSPSSEVSRCVVDNPGHLVELDHLCEEEEQFSNTIYPHICGEEEQSADVKRPLKLSELPPEVLRQVNYSIDELGRNGDYEGMISGLTEVIRQYPRTPNLYAFRADGFILSGKAQDAKADLLRAISLFEQRGNFEDADNLRISVEQIEEEEME
ncbi:MAG: hypothetical protein F6K19_23690 [Cyanothece sp. SIO1E1]|nr:hypothetical protein [Cyanothece sp. SIO1E1]